MPRPTAASGLIGALLNVAAAAEARESSNRLTGIFSNVQQSAETGDLGGLEIDIDADAPQPFATVVFCEGWCNLSHRVPIRLDGTKFTLSFAEPYYDESGKLAGSSGYRLNGYLSGDTVVVELQSRELRPEPWRETFRLTRQQFRFGLDVATTTRARP